MNNTVAFSFCDIDVGLGKFKNLVAGEELDTKITPPKCFIFQATDAVKKDNANLQPKSQL